MNDEQLNGLAQFLGAYFHQDWGLECEDADGVVRAFVAGESRESVLRVCEEIERLLSRDLSEEELAALVHGKLGGYYSPTADGMTYREWLRRVQTFLRRSLE